MMVLVKDTGLFEHDGDFASGMNFENVYIPGTLL